jgi:hypothetical protein
MFLHSEVEDPNMATPRRHHVKFEVEKKVSEPVEVKFVRKDGTRVDFPAHEKVKETVKVDFMAKNKRK